MGFLAGKRALIVGVASQRSIATGIADAMHREGAELAFTYQTEKLKSRVEAAAEACNSKLVLPLDVGEDDQIDQVFTDLGKHWDRLDILVHSVGFAPRDQIAGRFVESTTREGWAIAHDISAYSLVALAKAARPMMLNNRAEHGSGAILCLSYLGAERAVPNYNVMGPAKASLESAMRFLAMDLGQEEIRSNAISAGPIKTLAAAGVSGFRGMLSKAAEQSPLKRNVSIEEVGNTAAFLCSDLASGITGEVVYVDGGYNIMGLQAE